MFFKGAARIFEIFLQGCSQALHAIARALLAGGFQLRGGLGEPAGADIGRGTFDGVGCRRRSAEIFLGNLPGEALEKVDCRAFKSIQNVASAVDAGGGDKPVDLVGLEAAGAVGRNRVQIPSPRRLRPGPETLASRFCRACLNNIC